MAGSKQGSSPACLHGGTEKWCQRRADQSHPQPPGCARARGGKDPRNTRRRFRQFLSHGCRRRLCLSFFLCTRRGGWHGGIVLHGLPRGLQTSLFSRWFETDPTPLSRKRDLGLGCVNSWGPAGVWDRRDNDRGSRRPPVSYCGPERHALSCSATGFSFALPAAAQPLSSGARKRENSCLCVSSSESLGTADIHCTESSLV